MSEQDTPEELDANGGPAKKKKPNPNPVKEAILEMVAEKGVGGVVSPTHVAQAVSEGRWQAVLKDCLLYTSPSPRDQRGSRMPSSA